jgi:hypothetical protein
MTSSKKEIKTQIRMVERLLQAWDPIEVIMDQVKEGITPTEYDSYAPRILGLLNRGTSEEALARELSLIRTKDMGLNPDEGHDIAFANGLLKLLNNLRK